MPMVCGFCRTCDMRGDNGSGLRIFVCNHRRGFTLDRLPYVPVQAGRAIAREKLPFVGDDGPGGTGTDGEAMEISSRNPSFCELTVYYWVWKNMPDCEWIGICHYRRYLWLHPSPFDSRHGITVNGGDLGHFELTEMSAADCRGFDIALPRPLYLAESVGNHYAQCHSAADWQTLRQVVHDLCPEYDRSFEAVSSGRMLSIGNIMIARRRVFDDYCRWLFPILFECERRIDISSYDAYQRRIFGFMAERLLCVYVFHHTELRLRYGMMVQVDDSFPIQYRKAVRCRFGGRYLQRLAAVMLRRRILRLWRKLKK